MVQNHIIYKNAPIAEALIDIQVSSDSSIDLSKCTEQFASKFNEEFPSVNDIKSSEFEITLAADKIPSKPQVKDVGVRLNNKQNNKVLQARSNGFTLSYVNTYSNWDDFSAEAKLYWKEYLNIFKPKTVLRIAVRYINKLELPGPEVEPSDYFNLYPKVPSKIPQDIGEFLLRLIMPQTDIGSTAIINQATMPPSKKGYISVALDLDLFKETKLSANSEEIWGVLSQLRERKNLLFESCITDKTRKAIS